MAGRSAGLCLLLCAISCALCPVWCFHCQPTNCGCMNTYQGITVDLTAVDKMLTSRNMTVDAPNGVRYYLQLCTPLNLPDNCRDSLVCEQNTLTNTYTSFGQKGAISYSVVHMPLHLQVVMTIGSGDAVSGKIRRSTLVNIALIPGSNNIMVKLVSANTTTLAFSIVASIASGRPLLVGPLLVELEGSGMSNTSLTPSGASVPSKTTFSSTSDSSTSPSSTSTPSPSSTSPSSTSTPSPSSTSTPSHSFSTSSFSSNSYASSSTSTSIALSPRPSPHSTSPISPLHSVPPTTSTPSTLIPVTPSASSNPTPPSTFYISSSPPTSSSPSPHSPTFSPCTGCSESLALGLGIGIPATAILSSLATIIVCFCCQRVVKRKRQYIRLAPTVYFDEEEHD